MMDLADDRMIDLAELLAECDAHDIRLFAAGDGGLTIDAPQGVLTPDLMERLKARKAELLAVPRPAEGPAEGPARADPVPPAPNPVPLAFDPLAQQAQRLRRLSGLPPRSPIPDPPPKDKRPCHWCGHFRWWRSVYDVVICGWCHPPAFPGLVLEWLEPSEN